MVTPRSLFRVTIAFATILLCLVFARPSANYADQSVTLKGRVLTRDGQVIPSGVEVSLETDEGGFLGKRPTDAFGNYIFEGLKTGKYHLAVTADGFQA